MVPMPMDVARPRIPYQSPRSRSLHTHWWTRLRSTCCKSSVCPASSIKLRQHKVEIWLFWPCDLDLWALKCKMNGDVGVAKKQIPTKFGQNIFSCFVRKVWSWTDRQTYILADDTENPTPCQTSIGVWVINTPGNRSRKNNVHEQHFSTQ